MSSTSQVSSPPATQWRQAMPRWIQVTVLLIVFGSGMAVGAVGAARYMISKMQLYRAQPEVLPAEITDSLTGRLRLSRQQSADVLAIIVHRHAKIDQIRQESAPAIHREFDQMEKEVTALLDETQASRWHSTAQWVRRSFLPRNENSG
ncbi:MAG: hypothetical protein AAFU85_15320 [Planctomycetota bacterium]